MKNSFIRGSQKILKTPIFQKEQANKYSSAKVFKGSMKYPDNAGKKFCQAFSKLSQNLKSPLKKKFSIFFQKKILSCPFFLLVDWTNAQVFRKDPKILTSARNEAFPNIIRFFLGRIFIKDFLNFH